MVGEPRFFDVADRGGINLENIQVVRSFGRDGYRLYAESLVEGSIVLQDNRKNVF